MPEIAKELKRIADALQKPQDEQEQPEWIEVHTNSGLRYHIHPDGTEPATASSEGEWHSAKAAPWVAIYLAGLKQGEAKRKGKQ
jgi:hypothetical protein